LVGVTNRKHPPVGGAWGEGGLLRGGGTWDGIGGGGKRDPNGNVPGLPGRERRGIDRGWWGVFNCMS